MNRSEKLRLALRKGLLVRFFRPFELGSFLGYVLEVGPRFFLLAVLGESCSIFNGFSCLRLSDVRSLEVPHRYSDFVEAALKKSGHRTPRKPRVTLTSTEKLLLSASRAYPLVTIHREIVAPDICHIGQVATIGGGSVSLLEIGPDAKWDESPEAYRLREITRIDFGGGYEKTLSLVGGPAPESRA